MQNVWSSKNILFDAQKEYEHVLQEFVKLTLITVTNLILYIFRPIHTYINKFICNLQHWLKYRGSSYMFRNFVWPSSGGKCHTIGYTYMYIKVKCSRYSSGVAQRVGRGIAILFHDRETRREWVFSSTFRLHFKPRKDSVPILQEAGWAPGPVWKGGKSRLPQGFDPRPSSLQLFAIPTELSGPHFIYVLVLYWPLDALRQL